MKNEIYKQTYSLGAVDGAVAESAFCTKNPLFAVGSITDPYRENSLFLTWNTSYLI